MNIYPIGHCPVCKNEIHPTSNDILEKIISEEMSSNVRYAKQEF
jgi:predicted nucleic acid-binding Zn ribbon protein